MKRSSNVSIEDVASLAKLAGLEISQDRLERLRDEVDVALIAISELEAAARRAMGDGSDPFDAAWQMDGHR